jgi:hypothetical protein
VSEQPLVDPPPVDPPVADLGIHPAIIPAGTRCETHGDDDAIFRCATCTTFRCEACRWGKLGARSVCVSCAANGLPAPIAWERRAEIGVLRAFFRTAGEILATPTLFFRTPALEDDAVGGFEHGLTSFAVGQIAVVIQALATLLVFGSAFAIGTRAPVVAAVFGGYGCMLIGLVPAMMLHVPVTTLVAVGVASVAIHGSLRILGVAKAPFYAGTVRATSYSFATHVLFAVPLIGPPFALFWTMVIETIAIREVHRTSTLVALIAVLGYRLLFVVGLIGLYVLLGGLAYGLASAGH